MPAAFIPSRYTAFRYALAGRSGRGLLPFLLPVLYVCFTPFLLFGQWQVGAASAPISPQAGAFIAGHTQNRKFTGTHDDLYVKAVVISGSGGNLSILTVDCIGLLHPQLQDIRRKARERIPDPDFNPDHIVVSSTHSHAGPDLVGIWGHDMAHSGVDPVYITQLTDTATELLVRAWLGRQKAHANFSVTRYGEGWVENISEPEEIDRSVTTLRFMNNKRVAIATLTNFACHPTFVDAVHDKVSADYVGGFYRRMDSLYGGVNLFLQGSIGGWVQPEHEPKTFEQAFFRGRGLADAVSQSLYSAKKLHGRRVGFRSRIFQMPVENMAFRALSATGVINRKLSDSVETEIAVFRIGDAVFATHPGETVPEMGLQTKAMMKNNGPRFVLGLSMDAMGYILKPYFFDSERKIPHAEYLCGMSAGKQTGPIVMQVLRTLLGKKF
jgi:hypothetical protein